MRFTISKVAGSSNCITHVAIPSTISTSAVQEQPVSVCKSSNHLDAALAQGEFIIRHLVISTESPLYHRFLKECDQQDSITAKRLKELMKDHTIGVVVKSNNPSVKVGDLVDGICISSEYVKVIPSAARRQQDFHRSQRPHQCQPQECHPQTTYFKAFECGERQHNSHHVLNEQKCVVADINTPTTTVSYQVDFLRKGGLTAYIGLNSSGELKSGETLYVSVATGTLGHTEALLGDHIGNTVYEREHIIQLIGSVQNSMEQSLQQLKKQHSINKADVSIRVDYASESNAEDRHYRAHHHDTLSKNRHINGRMIVCGIISDYNESKTSEEGQKLLQLITDRLRQEGFIMLSSPELDLEYRKRVTQRLLEGRINTKNTVLVSVEQIPEALLEAFHHALGLEVFHKAKL